MIDATASRIATSLANIDRSLKQLTRIMETANENFVAFAKKIEAWEPDVTDDSAQLTLVNTPMKGDDETS